MKTATFATLLLAFGLSSASLAAPLSYPQDGLAADTGHDDLAKRRKPRIKGGSGCDDALDILEHPECR